MTRSKGFSTRLKWIIAFFFFFLSAMISLAQNSLVTQTIAQSRQLLDEQKFREAAAILEAFENQYPGDIWIERLYAQTLFWMHDYEESTRIYERALAFHPNDMNLIYEYAIMLFDYGKYEKAKTLLLEYTRQVDEAADAELILGKIFYYQGQFRDAYPHLKKAAAFYPQDIGIGALYDEVSRIIRPQLLVGGLARFDQQPMQTYGPLLELNWYRSDLLNMGLKGSLLNYADVPVPNLITSLQLTNSMQFRRQGLSINMAAGGIYSNADNGLDWNGYVEVIKKFKRPLQIDVKAERTNYEYTISSIDSLLMISKYGLKLAVGKEDGWNGEGGAQSQLFPDDNYVNSYYLWLLSKPLKFSTFHLSFGYAFSYMDAKEDRFEPTKTAAQIIDDGSETVDGIYNPYYTPVHQFNNSLLAHLKLQLGPESAFYGHASVGVFSSTDAPYYYLDYNNGNKLVLKKGFSTEKYIPLDLGISFHSFLSKTIEIKVSYTYLSTYYFISHHINLGLRFYL